MAPSDLVVEAVFPGTTRRRIRSTSIQPATSLELCRSASMQNRVAFGPAAVWPSAEKEPTRPALDINRAVCGDRRKLIMDTITRRYPTSDSRPMHDTRTPMLHACFVTGIAFGLNYLWETIQCPRFFIHLDGNTTPAVMVTATLGDVAMTWFAQVVVAIFSRRWLWLLEHWRWPQWTLLLAVALALSFPVEYWALGTARWAYTDVNPRIPGTEISALPVAQLVLLFPLTFGLTRLILRSTAMQAWRERNTSRRSP